MIALPSCSLHLKEDSGTRVEGLQDDVAGGGKGRMASEESSDRTVWVWELGTDPGSLDLPASASGGARICGWWWLRSAVLVLCVPEGSGTQSVKVSSAMGKMA